MAEDTPAITTDGFSSTRLCPGLLAVDERHLACALRHSASIYAFMCFPIRVAWKSNAVPNTDK